MVNKEPQFHSEHTLEELMVLIIVSNVVFEYCRYDCGIEYCRDVM